MKDAELTVQRANISSDERGGTDDKFCQMYCSYAVTGPQVAFQAIYVCRTCCHDEDNVLCFCQACADYCHINHEGLEYVGMGPCYCDCFTLDNGRCCQVIEQSIERASFLGLSNRGNPCFEPVQPEVTEPHNSYVRDVYQIISLGDKEYCAKLLQQALALVQISNETFWLDSNSNQDISSLCELEKLALVIFRQHATFYDGMVPKSSDEPASSGSSFIGAEWWVQVKSVSHPSCIDKDLDLTMLGSNTNTPGAVDLHYDKDEILAESFGIGYFPFLSTVTYLTNSNDAPPTLVFNVRYDQSSQDPPDSFAITEMMISYPEVGKHIVFDGRLLHGAPSHYALRKIPTSKMMSSNYTTNKRLEEDQNIRVTFLVNIWLNQKPAGVDILPHSVREAVNFASSALAHEHHQQQFHNLRLEKVHMNNETDLPLPIRGRIILPFVGGKETTWGDETVSVDSAAATVLATYPPPVHSAGSLLVQFGPGLEAFVEVTNDANSEES